MAPTNGDILSEISGVSGNWTGTYTVAYEASSSDTTNATVDDRFYRFKHYNTSNGTFNNASSDTSDTAYANRHSIKFFYNTGVWTDGSTAAQGGADPHYLTSGNTFAQTTSVSNWPQTLYTWYYDANNNTSSINHAYDLSQHSWASSGSGSGSGAGTHSTGSGNDTGRFGGASAVGVTETWTVTNGTNTGGSSYHFYLFDSTPTGTPVATLTMPMNTPADSVLTGTFTTTEATYYIGYGDGASRVNLAQRTYPARRVPRGNFW